MRKLPAAAQRQLAVTHVAAKSMSRTSEQAHVAQAQQQRYSQRHRIINSINEISAEFRGVLLDQFGVLHDGQQPYPQAISAVEALHTAGKKILVLSNSSRRSGGTINKLVKMGFKEEWFAGAITSGELTHTYLSSRPDLWWQQLGRRCIHLTWSSRGKISLDDLGLQVVTDPHEADFILAHGTEAIGQPDGGTQNASLEQMQQMLQQCVQVQQQQQGRQLPMIVANPDLVTVDGASLITMPGTLAKYYQQLGGHVRLMGKPDPTIYRTAMGMLTSTCAGASLTSPADWLAIGDSLEHDISGGCAAGVKTLFVAGGIHANQVQLAAGSAASSNKWDDAAMQQLFEQHGVVPDYCMAYLQC